MSEPTPALPSTIAAADPAGRSSHHPPGRWGPLTDSSLCWPRRLIALQGWRGDDIDRVLRAGPAVRFAPAMCAAGSLAVVATRSRVLVAALAAAAAVGAVTGRHPIESLHRAWAVRRGRPALPRARAGRRFACALAGTWLVTVGVADATGHRWWATGLSLALSAAATVFTTTGVCLPSLLLTAVGGADRATAPTLGCRSRCTGRRRPGRPISPDDGPPA